MTDATTIISPADWAEKNLNDPVHIDCTTTVMLKILDGKCKMHAEEKATIASIYQVIKHRPGKLLDQKHHQLIAQALQRLDDEVVMQVYEQRLYAETMISRPVMKSYKSMLRNNGLIS